MGFVYTIVIIAVLALLAWGALVFFFGGVGLLLQMGKGTYWAATRIKRGNPILFVIIALVGFVILACAYYNYRDETEYNRQNLMELRKRKDITQADRTSCIELNERDIEQNWQEWSTIICTGGALLGIGVVGSIVTIVYGIRKRAIEYSP